MATIDAVQVKMNQGAHYMCQLVGEGAFLKFGALCAGANQPRHFFTTDTEWMGNEWDSKLPVFGYNPVYIRMKSG